MIARALGADEAREPPRPRRTAVVVALGALLLAAAASGYVVGDSGSSRAKPRAVEAGAMRLNLPPGWPRRQPGGGIERLAARALVAGPAGDEESRIVAAELPRKGLGLLPDAAAARLEGVSRGEPVMLGDLRATRYRALESVTPRRRVSLYAAPTTRGVALVACAGPRSRGGRFMRRCGDVAATLSLARGREASDLAADDVAKVERTIALLDARRASARRRLGRARSRASRVRVVRALSAAHGGAARALERLPGESEARRASAAVIRSLRRMQRTYGQLATAAADGSRRREQAARIAVRRRDLELRRAVETL